jgi:hypothetical protein
MVGKELVLQLREDILDDAVLPYLWLDPALLRYLNYAEVQACRRAHLIIDSTTELDSGTAATAGTAGQQSLCRFTVVPDQASYTLSRKILQIRRCQLASQVRPLLGPLTYAEMDDFMPGWQGTCGTAGILVGTAGSGGVPTLFLNEPGNTVILVKAPSVADTAYLVVSRLPLIPFTLETAPEIDEKDHEGLLNWAAHLAYSKNDSETYNPQKAKDHAEKFTAQFGELPDAYTDRMLKTIAQNQRMRPRVFGS